MTWPTTVLTSSLEMMPVAAYVASALIGMFQQESQVNGQTYWERVTGITAARARSTVCEKMRPFDLSRFAFMFSG